MIVSTTDDIAGRRIVKTIGVVRGNAVRARHLGKDILAVLRNIVWGEIHEYVTLAAEAREEAMDRMVDEAEELGSNGIIGIRFGTALIMSGAAELLVYGTAVVVE